MVTATYVRVIDEDMKFINFFSREQRIKKSALIKELLHKAVKEFKLNLAIEKYKEGKITIREGAEIAGLTYRPFFDELCKRGLIGFDPEEQRLITKETFEYFGIK